MAGRAFMAIYVGARVRCVTIEPDWDDRYWAALATIVDNLFAHETLEGEEVEDIIRHWIG